MCIRDRAKLQRSIQAFPRLWVAPSGQLRSPQAVWRRLCATLAGSNVAESKKAVAGHGSDKDAAERTNVVAGSKNAALPRASETVDLFSTPNGLGLPKPQPRGGVPCVTQVSLTSVDKSGLVAANISTGLLQSAPSVLHECMLSPLSELLPYKQLPLPQEQLPLPS